MPATAVTADPSVGTHARDNADPAFADVARLLRLMRELCDLAVSIRDGHPKRCRCELCEHNRESYYGSFAGDLTTMVTVVEAIGGEFQSGLPGEMFMDPDGGPERVRFNLRPYGE